MKLIIPINVYDEYIDVRPDFCEVELSDKQLERYRTLAKAAKDLDVYKLVEFDHVDSFYQYDYDADDKDAAIECEDFRPECTTVNVTETHFYWSGYIKHTEIHWETCSVYFGNITANKNMDLREF